MRIHTKISLILCTLILISCGEKHTFVNVESEKIDNFSNINYKEAKDHPYFSDVKYLPFGFSLGDFKDNGSILFLTESANIFPFDDENLHHFLTKEELKTAYETYIDSSFTQPKIRKIQYYPYERLVTNSYVLLIINKRTNQSNGRNYAFDLRTYNFEGQLIDNITMAKWDDDNKEYFGGWIMPEMLIKREFSSGEIDFFEIRKDGQIIKKDANNG